MLHRLARVDRAQQPRRHGPHAIPDLAFCIAVAARGRARLCRRGCGCRCQRRRCSSRRVDGLGYPCRRRGRCRRFHHSRLLRGHGHGDPCRCGNYGRRRHWLGNRRCGRLFRGHGLSSDCGNNHGRCDRHNWRHCLPDRRRSAFARFGLAQWQWRSGHHGRRDDWPGGQQRGRRRDRSRRQQRRYRIHPGFPCYRQGDRLLGRCRHPVKTACRLQFIHGDAEPLHLDANPDNGGDFLDVGGIRRRHGKRHNKCR